MASILIDKLLQTVVNRKASDLHITVGQPPVVRIDGRLQRLETKVLEPADTTALMKSITPERCQQEIQEVWGGRTSASPSASPPGSACPSSSRRGTSRWCSGKSPRAC